MADDEWAELKKCDWSGMYVDYCQHCKDGLKLVGKTTEDRGGYAERQTRDFSSGDTPVIPATYNSTKPCSECGVFVFKDDLITKLGIEWVHEGCARKKVRK
jgi:hypothetical protein